MYSGEVRWQKLIFVRCKLLACEPQIWPRPVQLPLYPFHFHSFPRHPEKDEKKQTNPQRFRSFVGPAVLFFGFPWVSLSYPKPTNLSAKAQVQYSDVKHKVTEAEFAWVLLAFCLRRKSSHEIPRERCVRSEANGNSMYFWDIGTL